MGGDCVKTLPVSQLPHLTGVVTASCGKVVPERRTGFRNKHWTACDRVLLCDSLTRWGRSAGCRSPSGVPPGKRRSVQSEDPKPGRTHPGL